MKNLALSPDGNLLAVSYRCDAEPMRIGLMDLSYRQKFYDVIGKDGRYADSPTFSDDGNQMAYTSGFPGKFPNGIYTLNLQDRISSEILHSDMPNGFPTFSPDGNKIAFARAGRIRPKSAATPIGSIDIFLLSLGSKEVRKLTNSQYYQISGLSFLSKAELLIGGATGGSVGADAVILSTETLNSKPLDLGAQVSNVQYVGGTDTIFYVANHDPIKSGKIDYEVFAWSMGVSKKLTSHHSNITAVAAAKTGTNIAYLSEKSGGQGALLFVGDLISGDTTQVPSSIFEVCS